MRSHLHEIISANYTLLSTMSPDVMFTATDVYYSPALFRHPRKFCDFRSECKSPAVRRKCPGVIMTLYCNGTNMFYNEGLEDIKESNCTIREMYRLRIHPAD